MFKIGPPNTFRNATLPPNNLGLAKKAQARLNNTISRVNLRHQESIKVDAIDFHVWNRSRAGRLCTCQSQQNYTAVGSTVATKVDSIQPITNIGGFKIATFKRGVNVNPNSFQGLVLQAINSDKSTTLDEQLDDIVINAGQISPEEQARQDSNPAGYTFDEPESVRCGICLGTGFVDSWQLHNGIRIICDNSGTNPITSNKGWTIKENSRPQVFTSEANIENALVWMVKLPPYFLNAYTIIRNNTSPAYNIIAEMSLDNLVTWVPVNLTNLQQTINVGDTIPIRVRPTLTDLQAPPIEFTHIELIYDLFHLAKGQMPNLSRASSNDFAGPIINSSVEFSGDIENIDIYSILVDSKYIRVWQVSNATREITSQRQLYGITCDVIQLQNFELPTLLQIIRKPEYDLGYSGLEPIAGANLGG